MAVMAMFLTAAMAVPATAQISKKPGENYYPPGASAGTQAQGILMGVSSGAGIFGAGSMVLMAAGAKAAVAGSSAGIAGIASGPVGWVILAVVAIAFAIAMALLSVFS